MARACLADDRARGGSSHGSRRLPPLGRPVVAVCLAVSLAACAPTLAFDHPAPPALVRFDPDRDTFAFPNLVRSHSPGRSVSFANYCIVMARAASQFFRFARFAPARPPLTSDAYTRLTREVMAVGPWEAPRADGARIVIPGYADLRAFSRAHEAAIKAAFGSNVLSMLHWRTWRVGVLLGPAHQSGVAQELIDELDAGRPAPLMITNFPDPDLLNHAVLVYDYQARSGVVEFQAYDPNDPGNPLALHFDPATRAFWVEPLPYSPPGRIRAFRLYASPLL